MHRPLGESLHGRVVDDPILGRIEESLEHPLRASGLFLIEHACVLGQELCDRPLGRRLLDRRDLVDEPVGPCFEPLGLGTKHPFERVRDPQPNPLVVAPIAGIQRTDLAAIVEDDIDNLFGPAERVGLAFPKHGFEPRTRHRIDGSALTSWWRVVLTPW
jgi:hypothetical protein